MIQRLVYGMLLVGLLILLLILGKPVILPFVYALIIWFVIKKVRDLMDKMPFIRQHIPRWIKTILSGSLIFGMIYLIMDILIINLSKLAETSNAYTANISELSNSIGQYLHQDIEKEFQELLASIDFTKAAELVLSSTSELLGNATMIFFYVVFIFIEERIFESKFKQISSTNHKAFDYLAIFKRIDHSLAMYISLKSLTSFIGSFLSFFILLWSGIDSPLFWSLLIFITNFIPSIGPILGSVIPAIFSLLQFGSFSPFLIILLGTGGISISIGSFLEPRLMGNSLNISPLVAIISLAVWGYLWGIPGMLLCVPITVAMIIILAQFPSTRNLAILLSEKGEVQR